MPYARYQGLLCTKALRYQEVAGDICSDVYDSVCDKWKREIKVPEHLYIFSVGDQQRAHMQRELQRELNSKNNLTSS